jgi:hypothetical protein
MGRMGCLLWGAYYGVLPQECGVTADLSFSSGLSSVIHPPRTAHNAKLDQEHQGFFTRTLCIWAR